MKKLFVSLISLMILMIFQGMYLATGATISTPDLTIDPRNQDNGGANWYRLKLETAKTFNAISVKLEYDPAQIRVIQFSNLRTIIAGWTYTERIQSEKAEFYAISVTPVEGAEGDSILWAQIELVNTDEMAMDDAYIIKTITRLNESEYETTCRVSLDLLYGDISGDGTVSSFDAASILQWLVGISNEWSDFVGTRWGKQVVEVSADGIVTEYDAALILQKEAGTLALFPIEGEDIHPAPAAPFAKKAGRINIEMVRTSLREWEISIKGENAPAVSGYFEFWTPDWLVKAEKIEKKLLEEAMVAFSQENEKLKISWAQVNALEKDGELLSIKVRTTIPLMSLPIVLTKVRFDEGRVPVIIAPQERSAEKWKEMLRYFPKLDEIPSRTELLQNFPNPCNPETWLPFKLSEGAEVVIRIYSPNGALVRSFELGFLWPGSYIDKSRAVYWDGKNKEGERVASGVYLYQLQAGKQSFIKKLLLIK